MDVYLVHDLLLHAHAGLEPLESRIRYLLLLVLSSQAEYPLLCINPLPPPGIGPSTEGSWPRRVPPALSHIERTLSIKGTWGRRGTARTRAA